jgi:tRNA nucleotidyltransferase/poly(A) polymerase
MNVAGTSPGELPLQLPPFFTEEAVRALAQGQAVYLVGGAVRDMLLGRVAYDLDFATQESGLQFARRVAEALQADFYPLDPERDVGRVLVTRENRRWTLDFASLRGSTIEADLRARDFAINSMAIPLHSPPTLIDPLGGARDLRDHLLRTCSSSAISEDPVRSVRGVRLAVQLGLRMEGDTREQVRSGAGQLGTVAPERLRDEFFRILSGPKVATATRTLMSLRLLSSLIPEVVGLDMIAQPGPQALDVWDHTLLVLDRLEMLLAVLAPMPDEEAAADLIFGLVSLRLGRFRGQLAAHLQEPVADARPARGLLFLAGLLHDAGKSEIPSSGISGTGSLVGHEELGGEWALHRALALRFSREEAERVSRTVRGHVRPMQLLRSAEVSPLAIYRYYRSLGSAGVDVSLLSLADFLAARGTPVPQPEWTSLLDLVRALLGGYYERRREIVDPVPYLDGDELMAALGLRPGPQIGALLEALREAQVAGEVRSKAEALSFARGRMHHTGASPAAAG